MASKKPDHQNMLVLFGVLLVLVVLALMMYSKSSVGSTEFSEEEETILLD